MKLPMFAVAALAAASLAACGLDEPGVGKCTNADLTTLVETDVKVVDCGSVDATSKITREAKARTDCKFMSLQTAGRVFCAEPLPGMGK
jgi:hypothetical protein